MEEHPPAIEDISRCHLEAVEGGTKLRVLKIQEKRMRTDKGKELKKYLGQEGIIKIKRCIIINGLQNRIMGGFGWF